jgi:hypothetical protein
MWRAHTRPYPVLGGAHEVGAGDRTPYRVGSGAEPMGEEAHRNGRTYP